jgi:hypothetical protein
MAQQCVRPNGLVSWMHVLDLRRPQRKDNNLLLRSESWKSYICALILWSCSG